MTNERNTTIDYLQRIYRATARSNYFAVKDIDAFTETVRSVSPEGVVINSREKDGKTLYSILFYGGKGVPKERNEPDFEVSPLHWQPIFMEHLEDNWVAVLMEAGGPWNLDYVSGFATAYNNQGETVHLDLDDIYQQSKVLGQNLTYAVR